MKFSELVSKITIEGQNQILNNNVFEKALELNRITKKHNSIIQEKESNIQCRVNGKARKLQKETTESEAAK